jgi:vancomycin permeability regulator SanA
MRLLKHRLVKSCLGLIVLLFLVACLAIMLDGLSDNLHPADLAVVLGSRVQLDGSPSESLKARLDHTLDLYREGYFKLILVSGGRGKEGYEEAVVMRDYLASHGVLSDSILVDKDGYTTWRTAQDTVPYLTDHHLHSVLIISQYFHLPRCRLAFAKFGIGPVYWSHAPFWALRDFHSVPREVFAYADYSFRTAHQIDASTTSE